MPVDFMERELCLWFPQRHFVKVQSVPELSVFPELCHESLALDDAAEEEVRGLPVGLLLHHGQGLHVGTLQVLKTWRNQSQY